MKYEYDVAISYKNEIEAKARKIASYLQKDGWKVFFAPENQQELLSEEISPQLYDIYKNRSLLKLLLISEGYLAGEWTMLEKRVALESTKENRKRLVIVNYTNRELLPGELEKPLYLEGYKLMEDEIASIVTERINKYLIKDSGKSGGKEKEQKAEKRDSVVQITVNHGIIASDNASFGNIQF